jgi:hypothetical protein
MDRDKVENKTIAACLAGRLDDQERKEHVILILGSIARQFARNSRPYAFSLIEGWGI